MIGVRIFDDVINYSFVAAEIAFVVVECGQIAIDHFCVITNTHLQDEKGQLQFVDEIYLTSGTEISLPHVVWLQQLYFRQHCRVPHGGPSACFFRGPREGGLGRQVCMDETRMIQRTG